MPTLEEEQYRAQYRLRDYRGRVRRMAHAGGRRVLMAHGFTAGKY